MAEPLLVGTLALLVATLAAVVVAMAHYRDVPEDSPYAHGACPECGRPLSEAGACPECTVVAGDAGA